VNKTILFECREAKMRNRVGKHILPLIVLFVTLLSVQLIADPKFDELFNSGDYAGAIAYAEENIPGGKRDAALWIKIGFANEKENRTEKALACYMVAIRSDAKSYDGHLGAARIYNDLKQYVNGMSMAKKAMDLKMTGEASWEYARACIALQKPKEARKALEKVVETDPSNTVANKQLGTILFEAKEYKDALPLLMKSYQAKADDEVAYKIGRAYQEMGNLDASAKYLEMMWRSKTTAGADATVALAKIYFEKKKYSDAIGKYEKANSSKLKGEDYYNWGYSIEKTGGSFDDAIKQYQSATEKFGSSSTDEALLAREKVGQYYLERKDYSKALTHFKLISQAKNAEKIVKSINFLMADAYAGLGKSRNTSRNLSKQKKAMWKRMLVWPTCTKKPGWMTKRKRLTRN
jgi:tetratricopeptide (TPR) repeat protein